MEFSINQFSRLLVCGLALVELVLPLKAYAGGVDGGGGGALRCEVPDGDKIQVIRKVVDGQVVFETVRARDVYKSPLTNGRNVQIFDLWEAGTGRGPFYLRPRDLDYSGDAPEVQTERALSRLEKVSPEFAVLVRSALAHVRANTRPIPRTDYVPAPSDTGIQNYPLGCIPIGFADYSDREDEVVIDLNVADETTKTDFAALYIHEAVYKVLRDREDVKDSWKARRIVGLMFSKDSFTRSELENGFPKSN